MVDLSSVCGLPLFLDETARGLPLWLSGGLQPGALIERSLDEVRPTLLDPTSEGPDPAYFMYNGVATFRGTDGPVECEWRYDLTVLPPGQWGREYVRTMGHYHSRSPGARAALPEVYEVLHGSALFILQRVDDKEATSGGGTVRDLIVVRAEPGEKAILPPDYGHWTVNTTEGPLVICNWVAASVESLYDPVIRAGGPCVRVIVGTNGPAYEPNRAYVHVPPLIKHARPAYLPDLGLEVGRPIFTALHQRPDLWRYLCDPTAWRPEFARAIEVVRTDPFPVAGA